MEKKSSFIKLATDLPTFFGEEVAETAAKQGLSISEPVSRYLGAVLARFSETEQFFQSVKNSSPNLNQSSQQDTEKTKLEFPVLAKMWLESLSIPVTEQYFALQQLGDMSLFMTGFFNERITRNRSMLDMDYYMAMGEMAYQRAGHIRESIQAERAVNVFFELSKSFENYVEVFAELSDRKLLTNDKDILKLYEKWLASGSHRISRMLSEAGIIPSKGKGSADPLS
jgi:hypothetical protein